MANRINYTDKVALNARTEIAEINKHTAANDNEIKNVVNAHATNIEILEANQTSGVIRADTIVDEGDGRSFLPVTGDTSTAYIVDGETAPDEAKNGNYEWDGAAYTKTAYQTVAGSKTDLATNGSQDVFTSQGAFDLDADLQGQIDSNDVEIAQNISDIAQNTLDIAQNEFDIDDNKERSRDTKNILDVGSDAYTHAERGVSDGFTTERLVQLDNEIEANLDADFYFKAGHSKGAGKIGIAVPDVSAADLSLDRNSNATFVNKRGVIETALPNVARFDWSSGEPVLLTEPQAENLIEDSNDFNQWADSTSGSGISVVINSNYAISPNGTSNATNLQFDLNGGNTSSDNSLLAVVYTATSGQELTSSIWIKSADSNNYDVALDTDSQQSEIITATNQWQRLETSRVGSNTGARTIKLGLRGSFGTSDNANILVYGAQVEAGDKATSYIPTDGATAVRFSDAGIETGDISQYIDSTNFTFEFTCEALSNSSAVRVLSLSDGTDNNRVNFYFLNPTQILLRSEFNNVVSTDVLTTVSDPTIVADYKISVVGGNTIELFIDGSSKGTSTIDTPLPMSLKYLKLSVSDGSNTFYSKVYNIKIS